MSYITSHYIHNHNVPIKSYLHINQSISLLLEPRFVNMDQADLYDQYVTVTNLQTQELGIGYLEYIR